MIPRSLPSQGESPPQPRHCPLPTVIQHPRFKELHRRITECLAATAESGEPHCLCLTGETGVGKSTLVQSYADAFPRYHTDHGTKVPVLYLETPHPITVKGMTSAMLDALGDPRAFKGTQPEMNARLTQFLTDCKVQLVMLDDFHHLMDKKNNRILRDVSEWLKVLIKNTRMVYLVVGIEGEVEQILTANPQLSRLFVRERLASFAWDARNSATIEEFARLISYVQAALEARLTEEVEPVEWLYRIHCATNGVMSSIINLFRKAQRIQCSQEMADQPISLELLALAYQEDLENHVGRPNPFLTGTKLSGKKIAANGQKKVSRDNHRVRKAHGV